MSKNEKKAPETKARAKGKKIIAGALKWEDGEDVCGTLVSVGIVETKHGPRTLVVIHNDATEDSEPRYMPAGWHAKLEPNVGQRVAIARDGTGLAARYDVRILDVA